MALLKLALDLLHGLKPHTHDDQDARPAEREVLIGVEHDKRDRRHQRDQTQIQRTGPRDAVQHVTQILSSGRPARIPGMNPPYFFMLSATSSGLKVMAT